MVQKSILENPAKESFFAQWGVPPRSESINPVYSLSIPNCFVPIVFTHEEHFCAEISVFVPGNLVY